MNRKKLSDFLAEVSEWRWDEFVRAELDMGYTTRESIVFAVVRACAMENLPAIKTALNRLDGKLVTPVKVMMPKVYWLYPNAKEDLEPIIVEKEVSEMREVVVATEAEMAPVPDSPTRGFRETMDKMSEVSRELPQKIIDAQNQIEKHIRNEGRAPESVPRVKSVVVAHALKMAQDRNMDAINEVFDRLDGKLVETIKVVGEDMYIMSFAETAPPGAFRNEEGVLMIEATQAQNLWRDRLSGNTGTVIIEG